MTQYKFINQIKPQSAGIYLLLTSKEGLQNKNSEISKLIKKYPKISNKIKQTKFDPEKQTLLTFDLFEDGISQLVLLGYNTAQFAKLTTFEKITFFRKLGVQVYERAKALEVNDLFLFIENLQFDKSEYLNAFIESFELAAYSFQKYKFDKKTNFKLNNLYFYSKEKIKNPNIENSILISSAVALARDLINMPASDCNPQYLVNQAKNVAKSSKLKIEVFDRAKLQKIKAGGLLAVSSADNQNAFLVKMTYRPKIKAKKVLALIGKGITFDSGGLSIKTGVGMETMKCDMSGAAAVLATMSVLSKLKPEIEVRAYLAICENAISPKAIRPGDIFKAMNGKTVEVLNTDAEGRLVLSDAICLANQDKCDLMIDLATLTGACVVALGKEYAGLFSNDPELSQKIINCGEQAGERYWPMPLAPEYKDMLKSPIADLKNIGARDGAGAITAALFLQEFVGTTKWAHLDIAGPAFADGDKLEVKKGGVGFGVRTLVRVVMSL